MTARLRVAFAPLLLLLIAAAPFGHYLLPIRLLGVTAFAFRLLILAALVILAVSRSLTVGLGTRTRQLAAVLGIWLCYAALTLLWAPDIRAALHEIGFLPFGLAIHLTLASLVRNVPDAESWILRGWVIAFAGIVLISLWEMLTGNHLPSMRAALLERLPAAHYQRWVPAATFVNPNNLALYMVASLCLFLAAGDSRSTRRISTVAIVICVVMIHVTRSRVVLLALIALLGVYATDPARMELLRAGMRRRRVWLQLGLTALLVVLVFVTPPPAGNPQLTGIFSVIEDPAAEQLTPESAPGRPLSSLTIRRNLVANGLEFLRRSYGAGIGAGAFRVAVGAGAGGHPTAGITDPHSWPLEVLSQYGVLVFALFFGWLALTLLAAQRNRLRAHAAAHQRSRALADYALYIGVAYVVAGNAPSSFIGNSTNWLLLSMLAIAVDAGHAGLSTVAAKAR